MKTPPLETIKSLVPSLTAKDQKIAERLILLRDYEGLKELVDSAIIRAKKSLNSDSPKEEYLQLDLEQMSELQIAVNNYLKYFDFGDDNEDEDSFGDDDFLEDLEMLETAGIW